MVITFTLQPTYSGATYVAGPFNISGTTNTGVTTKLASNVSKSTLLAGLVITGIADNTIGGTIQSIGTCNNSISWSVGGTPTPTPSCGIQLISVNNVSGTTWEYNFVSGELCYTTILEYSTNNVTWTGFGGGCNSPRYCDIGTQVGTIYFRISQYCPSNGPIVSNTISYTLPTPTPITPTPTPSPNTWYITNQNCGGSATLNTVSVNSVSMDSFTPLTSTSYVTRTNPNGVNYGNNNTIMVGVSNIPSGSAARILVSINNGAREYYTNYTTNPSPFLTVNNVLINSGDFVKVSLQCNI